MGYIYVVWYVTQKKVVGGEWSYINPDTNDPAVAAVRHVLLAQPSHQMLISEVSTVCVAFVCWSWGLGLELELGLCCKMQG